ncbi:hypothetical protein [Clostridium sp.]|uniref:hypothetical protein n=1 Tax=Clostridium sp. TaxID=1506 RepID=UPI0025B9BFC5|nr:hypothetical protein [Clostridium sp.]
MKKLTIEEAIQAYKDNDKGMIYKLYDDNTEAAIEDIKEFEDDNFYDYEYGIELEMNNKIMESCEDELNISFQYLKKIRKK